MVYHISYIYHKTNSNMFSTRSFELRNSVYFWQNFSVARQLHTRLGSRHSRATFTPPKHVLASDWCLRGVFMSSSLLERTSFLYTLRCIPHAYCIYKYTTYILAYILIKDMGPMNTSVDNITPSQLRRKVITIIVY